MKINHKIFLMGIFWGMVSVLWSVTGTTPELKTVDTYFNSTEGKNLLKNEKTKKLQEHINVYHLYSNDENKKNIKEILEPLANCQDTYDSMNKFNKKKFQKKLNKKSPLNPIFSEIRSTLEIEWKELEPENKPDTEEEKRAAARGNPLYSAIYQSNHILDEKAWKRSQLLEIATEAFRLNLDEDLNNKIFKKIQEDAKAVINFSIPKESILQDVKEIVKKEAKEQQQKEQKEKEPQPFTYTQTIAYLLATFPEKINQYALLLNDEQKRQEFLDTLIKGVISSFSHNNFVIDGLKTMIKREEEFKERFVFYTGYSAAFDFWFNFNQIIEKYLFFQKKTSERSVLEGIKIFDSVDNLLKSFTGSPYDDDFSQYVYAVNVSLFGNLGDKGSCTIRYFLEGISAVASSVGGGTVPLDMVKKICETVGINYSKFEKKLKFFEVEYATCGGKLKQFFVKEKDVNTLMFMCEPLGFLYTRDVHGAENWLSFLDKVKNNADQKSLLTLFRNDPRNELLQMQTDKQNIVIDGKEYPRKAVDFLQARLLANPELLEKLDVKTYYIFARKEAQDKHEIIKKDFEFLIKEMIIDGLNSGKIVPSIAEKGEVKLVTLKKSKDIEKKQDPFATALFLLKVKLLSLAKNLE